ncbi:hypothetical protein [Cognatilysobacter terrigena]|uniref:hypothetical protein n=1 Tax=Cognatilysobacter terrigena TaxID=2488749 RepID=UPI001061C61E|nr:hypothetical protein [Lysobacter terrigena]
MSRTRVLWLLGGFALAPILPPLLLLGKALLGGEAQPFSGFAMLLVVSYVVSAPLVAALGLPALLLAVRFGADRWWVASLVGGACGAAFSFTGYSQEPPLVAILQFGLWGAVVAASVWLSWRLGRIHEARLAANNSSKPTPLRGAA